MRLLNQSLSHYTIIEKLGAGGMGEVYQAKDQKLGRDVAIKVLPEEFAKDADRVARFQREAKVLASLNHPNIAAIYGLEEFAGTNFLVLELVEGETLADRIKAGPIPVEESLKLALQIAEALEAAHEKGVIHRDLKPANIKVTPEGKVKVLDFGLAKAFAGEQSDLNLSNSPTLTNAATQQGVILGTAAYMSPEQARGDAVDQRTDIWAFGCVLFEMLTGSGTFEGRTVTDVLASILKSEPTWNRLPANLHPRIRLLFERCLEKEQINRYHNIADARVDIRKVLTDPDGMLAQSQASTQPETKLRSMLPWIGPAIVVTAIIAGLAGWFLKPMPKGEPKKVLRFSCNLPQNEYLDSDRPFAISPDGSRLLYRTNKGLYLRSLNRFEATSVPIPQSELVMYPFFSPDGQWIGYQSRSSTQLKKVPIVGGSPVKICDADNLQIANWSGDNLIVYGQTGHIMRIPSDGGIPETMIEGKGEPFFDPQVLPDGKSVLFTFDDGKDYKVAVQTIGSGLRKVLFPGRNGRYVPTGHIIYGADNNLFAVQFDAEKLEVKGEHVPMVQDLYIAGPAQYAISPSGTLAYVPAPNIGAECNIVWVDWNGHEEASGIPPGAYHHGVCLSPDGTQAAIEIRDQANDIWLWNFNRNAFSRFTFDPGVNRSPVWTLDGKRLAFTTERNGAADIYWQSADGSGSPEPLTKAGSTSITPCAFTPDGKQLVFTEGTEPYRISLLDLPGGTPPKVLFESKFSLQNPEISPDGRWIAYQSNESGRNQIYVRPFPNMSAGRWQISTEGGVRPLWSRDRHELFYYVPPGTVMTVPVELTRFSHQ